jgi:group I intron endonuclease
MASGVYSIASNDGRRYIGSAVNIDKRWREHRRGLDQGKHHSRFMQRAWDKHGPEAFTFSVLLLCDRENVLFYEQRCLDAYAPEYNTAPIAGSQLGYRHSQESRAKMSAARPKDFSPMKGRKHTPEALAKISASRKGKGCGPRTPERLAKIGAAQRGRPKSAEHRAKIAATLTGTSTGRGTLTEEQVRAIRALHGEGLRQFQIADALCLPRLRVHTVVAGHGYGWVK